MIYLVIILSIVCVACSSADIEEQKDIQNRIIELDSQQAIINKKLQQIIDKKSQKRDFNIAISKGLINEIFKKISYHKTNDIVLKFHPTKPFVEDEKNILGIKYRNYINIDSGKVNINIKKIELKNLYKNKINAVLELEGTGYIALSGKNTGIPASVRSKIKLYMKEDIRIKIKNTEYGDLLLQPEKQELKLKSKFTVNIAGWEFPWRESFELQLEELIDEIRIPMNLKTYFDMPFHELRDTTHSAKYINHKLILRNSNIRTRNNTIEYSTDVDIRKK